MTGGRETKACRHCGVRLAHRPRGLCWSCYHEPGVKELYPSTSKYARCGVGNFAGSAPLALAPTAAAPGSPEKVAVMCERAARGESVIHPADALYEGDPRPAEFLKARATDADL